MHHCWICLRPIPDGEESRDHIIPRTRRTPLKSSEWFWACKRCNNVRQSTHFLEVEKMQKLLDKTKPGWVSEDIRELLRQNAHVK